MVVSLVVAVSENGVIGNKGVIPWDLSGDRKYFAAMTKGHPVIMGFRTYESIQRKLGGPLQSRKNIVLINRSAVCAGFELAWSPEQALKLAFTAGKERVFVIGGQRIYQLFMPLADTMYITRVHAVVEGDTFFPEYDPCEWLLRSTEEHSQDERNEYGYTFDVYERRVK